MINIRISDAVKVNGDKALFISFPYDSNIVNVIRSCPSKWWWSEEKQWEVPFLKLGYLLENLQQYKIQISGDVVTTKPEKKADIKINFKFKTTPYEHQLEAFKYGMTHDKWLLADDMGLGKTKQSIDIAVARKQKCGYKHCLIVCGVNCLKWNWYDEVHTHSDEEVFILGQRLRNNGKIYIGSTNDKYDDLCNLGASSPYFIITNIRMILVQILMEFILL